MKIKNISTGKILSNYPKEKFDSLKPEVKRLYKVIDEKDEKEIEVTADKKPKP